MGGGEAWSSHSSLRVWSSLHSQCLWIVSILAGSITRHIFIGS